MMAQLMATLSRSLCSCGVRSPARCVTWLSHISCAACEYDVQYVEGDFSAAGGPIFVEPAGLVNLLVDVPPAALELVRIPREHHFV